MAAVARRRRARSRRRARPYICLYRYASMRQPSTTNRSPRAGTPAAERQGPQAKPPHASHPWVPASPLGRGKGGAVRVGVIGATGYVGAELVRLLQRHPAVRVVSLVARNRERLPVGDTFAHLAETGHRIDGALPEAGAVDAVFFALPHGQAAAQAPGLVARGVLVLDMGADFRLSSAAEYEEWYRLPHPAPELLPGGRGRAASPGLAPVAAAVYGLPEVNRDALRTARLIACPGCYPTATLLALAPLARAGLIADLVVDAKSGVSGAGREPKLEMLFGEVNESIRAYGIGGHRHLPEIREQLGRLGATDDVLATMTFTPHLVPMTRGLLATCHVRTTRPVTHDEIASLYEDAYGDEPFVSVAADAPATKSVTGSNVARVHARVDPRSGRVLALGVIDSMVKGAAGQAIQAFNLAAGLPETLGLAQLPLYP
jgi:N-acetyl-gamma-glutamyl-phosphate reductase